jgi:deoxycytidylate deaminase
MSERIQRFGWEYQPSLCADENYLDLALLLARNANLKGGSMGCVIVSAAAAAAAVAAAAATEAAAGAAREELEVIAQATNSALYTPGASDVHAEVNAIASCARRGVATAGATIYITMPPCAQCFTAIQAAGVRRVVSRLPCAVDKVSRAMAALGVEYTALPDTAERVLRRERFLAANPAWAEARQALLGEREQRKRSRTQLTQTQLTQTQLTQTQQTQTQQTPQQPRQQGSGGGEGEEGKEEGKAERKEDGEGEEEGMGEGKQEGEKSDGR